MNVIPLATLMNVLLIMACILASLTTVQNIIRMVRKERNFNIFMAILRYKDRNKKGFVSKFENDAVALKSLNQLCGVVFGKLKDKFVVKPETVDGHMLVIGGAGSGKSSSICIPTLMSWKERAFVIDIKGELYDKTKTARGESQIKVFNPTDRTAYRYDPFYALKNTDDLSGEARALAMSICPLSAEVKDPFWVQSAQNMLTGLLLYFFNMGGNFSESMRTIKSKSIKSLISVIMENKDDKAIAELSQFDGMDDKTISGVFTELSNHITVFATSDDLQWALSGEGKCITPADLENGYDVYCCIPEYKRKRQIASV